MNCKQLIKRLWEYFESKLSDEEHDEVDAHAADCSTCGPLLEKCRELSCRDLTEFMGDYVENQLSPERKAIFERHLTVCTDCIAYLDAYRKTIALARTRPESGVEDMPPDLFCAILDSWTEDDD